MHDHRVVHRSRPSLHARRCLASLAAVLCALAAAGCQSAEQECHEARTAAEAEWSGYVQALDQVRATAAATRERNQRRLTLDVRRRLYPQSEKRADAHYNRSDSAWLRAQQKAFQELCNQDRECSGLEHENHEASATIADLDERLPLARAALSALDGDPEQAQRAAKAAIIHPEYPQLKQAQTLSGEARERCADVKPAAEHAVFAR
jgi:hypothetical protein